MFLVFLFFFGGKIKRNGDLFLRRKKVFMFIYFFFQAKEKENGDADVSIPVIDRPLPRSKRNKTQ